MRRSSRIEMRRPLVRASFEPRALELVGVDPPVERGELVGPPGPRCERTLLATHRCGDVPVPVAGPLGPRPVGAGDLTNAPAGPGLAHANRRVRCRDPTANGR